MTQETKTGKEHYAFASAKNVAISTKHSIEISKVLRSKTTAFGKTYLEQVIDLKKAVPMKTFNRDVGHKKGKGMAAGRYPIKAAKEFLALLKSVEANAQFKGLTTSNLKITKILANKATIPMTGGRHRRATKRSNLEIEVKELATKKTDKKVKPVAKKENTDKVEQKAEKTEEKDVEKAVEEKPVAETKEEPKVEEPVKEEKTETPVEEETTEDKKSSEPQKQVSEKTEEQPAAQNETTENNNPKNQQENTPGEKQ
jgi:large subunit ribosomal protein L22